MKMGKALGQELMHSCKNGNMNKIAELLEKGANVDFRDSVGCTPLWVACWKGWTAIVRFLLDHNADLDIAKNNGATPLYIASELGNVEIVQILVDSGADIDKPMKDSSTPLYIASQHGHTDVVRFLLKNGANIFNQRRGGSSALYIGSQKGHLEVVTELLHYGADCNGEMDDGSSPLYIASQFGHLELVRQLLKHGADVNKAMNDLSTPIYIASQNGYAEIVSILNEHGADTDAQMNDGTTPLYIACQNGQEEVVGVLLNCNAALDLADNSGVTPLWIAAQNGHSQIVEHLVKAGADIDRARTNGDTALVRACDNGHGDVVQALVAGNADVNIRSKNGKTALHYASWRGDLGIINLLIKHGAELDVQDASGFTPLAKACNYGWLNVVKLLLSQGADPKLPGWNENNGLHLAAWNGFDEVVEVLLQQNSNDDGSAASTASAMCVDLDQQNVFGWTALHLAACVGHDPVVGRLLKHGALDRTPNSDGNTPLHLAAQEGHLGVVKNLLSHCKQNSYSMVNKCGWTPLGLAQSKGHMDVVDLMYKYVPAAKKKSSQNGHTDKTVEPWVRFQRVLSKYVSGVALDQVLFLPASRLLESDQLLPYDMCRKKDWLVSGEVLASTMMTENQEADHTGVLFVCGSWGVLDDPNLQHAQFKVVKDFLLSLDTDVGYVWLECSCLCPNTKSNADLFLAQRRAVLAALFAAKYVLLVPQIDFVSSVHDVGHLIPYTNLIDYAASPWGALGVLAALVCKVPAFLAFQCGDYISFQGLNRLQACSIEIGFLRAVVTQWNHLMNTQNEDFIELVPILSSKWLDMEEPIIQVRYVIDVAKQAEIDIGTLSRVCRLQLKAIDFKPGHSSTLLQLMSSKLGQHSDEEEKAFLLNLVLLLGYYSIGLLDTNTKKTFSSLTEDGSTVESGIMCCQSSVEQKSCSIQ